MIEKEIVLMGRIASVLNKEEKEILNTSFVDIMEKLVKQLEREKLKMKMNQYQDLTSRTAPFYDDVVEEIVDWTLGIAGEAGEIVEHVKKAKNHKHPWEHQKLAYELGDLMFYIARLSNVIGYSLDEISLMNIEKRYRRYPNGFNSKDSIERKE
jgi:NTP pyrophosphatase (non-canonical NTP hydrolase)